jgi:uncharacterized repeat protein (TIGR04076 family)
MGIIVEVHSIMGRCKYHKKRGEIYTLEDLAPEGMCLDAYHAVYPYSLALSEGAVFGWMRGKDVDSVFAQCSKGVVVMRINRFLFRDGKEKKQAIVIKVVERRGECQKNMEINDEFLFNLGGGKEICPAGFNSIYPHLARLGICDCVNFIDDIIFNDVRIECPDDKNRIVYCLKVAG